MKRCLHNRKGLKPRPGAHIKVPGRGKCHECTYDPKNNKNCKGFYQVTFSTFEAKGAPEMFTNDDKKWKKFINKVIYPRSSAE